MRTFLSRITNTEQRDHSRAAGVKSLLGTAGARKTADGGRTKAGGGSRPAAEARPGRKPGARAGATAGTRAGGKSGTRTGGKPGTRTGTTSRPKSGTKGTRSADGATAGAGGPVGGLRRWWTGEERGAEKSRGTAQAGDAAKRTKRPEPEEGAAPAAERHGPSAVVRVPAMLLAFAGMVAFAGVLSRLTLEPSAASASIAHTNLEPGSSIQAYLSQPAFQDTVKQLGGNILLGVPFGVLLPVLIPRARGFLRVTLATAVVMLLVELVQGALINGRAFDIDDVILNSTGALLGYLLLGRRLGRAVHPPRRRWWQRLLGRPVAH